MIYPQQVSNDVPLSKMMGAYQGPGYDAVAEREIADLRQQATKTGQEIKALRADLQALRARISILLTLAFALLGAFGLWLAAITYRMAAHP